MRLWRSNVVALTGDILKIPVRTNSPEAVLGMLVNTRLRSLGVGLPALRGAELVPLGWSGTQIAAELTRLRDRSVR